MIVITVTNCPPGLRGHLTGWLQEIDTGVYVGHINARVREELWKRVCEYVKSGSATMVFSANNEQRANFRVHNAAWKPIDYDGLTLMLHPSIEESKKQTNTTRGFSKAAKMRKARMFAKHIGMEPSENEQYIVIDVETNGLNPQADCIIEIGALHIVNGQVTGQFSSLVKTPSPLPSSIQELTGITDEMLDQEGKPLREVIEAFFDFAGDMLVVAHNVNFDYSFIRSACTKCQIPFFNNVSIDTYELARRRINDVRNYKLKTLAEHLDIRIEKSHRSISDCWTIKQLYDKLNKMSEV